MQRFRRIFDWLIDDVFTFCNLILKKRDKNKLHWNMMKIFSFFKSFYRKFIHFRMHTEVRAAFLFTRIFGIVFIQIIEKLYHASLQTGRQTDHNIGSQIKIRIKRCFVWVSHWFYQLQRDEVCFFLTDRSLRSHNIHCVAFCFELSNSDLKHHCWNHVQSLLGRFWSDLFRVIKTGWNKNKLRFSTFHT